MAAPSPMALSTASASALSSAPSTPAHRQDMEVQSVYPMSSSSRLMMGNSTGRSAAPASSKLIGGSHFTCAKCKYLLPQSMMSLSKPGECTRDVNSYKALADRWKNVRSLRKWWAGLTFDQQVEWYRKQHAGVPGTKRRFDDCTYQESSINEGGIEEEEQDHFQPWWLFRDHGLGAGRSLQQLEQEFREAVEKPGSDAIYRRGEWLVPRFAGVTRAKVARTLNRQDIMRKKSLEGTEQLTDLQASGQK